MDKTASLPMGADMGAWAANEVQKHEEVCGLRYEAIAKEQKRLADLLEQSQRDSTAALLKATSEQAARTKVIEDKISGGVKWVMGIVASLSVALLLMFFQNAQAQKSADESDKRDAGEALSPDHPSERRPARNDRRLAARDAGHNAAAAGQSVSYRS